MNPELTKEKVLSNLQDFGYKAPSTSQVGGAITRQGIISQDGTTPITADSLTPETPIVTPNAPTPTASLGVSTQAEQYAKSSKANADAEQQRLDKQQEALQSSEQSIADIITGMGEAGAKKQQAYQDQGLIDIKKSSDSVRTAMESANLATRRRIEELQKNNPEGQSASALSAQIRDIEAKNASYQADQAIVLSALNRDFETAKSFIDAKVDAETEQMKATLDARTFLYENNKDRFTKAEQRKIEADLRDEKRVYDEDRETKKTFEETKIEAMKNAVENGAPASVIQRIAGSGSTEEVITNAGEYGTDILAREIKKAQLDNLYADTAKKKADGTVQTDANGKVVLNNENASKISKEIVSNDNYKSVVKGETSLQFLETFENLFNSYGSTSGVFSPVQNKELKSSYNTAILNLKEFFNLGVLNGPDETILRGILPDPTDKSALNLIATGATENGIKNIKENISKKLDSDFSAISSQYGDYSTQSVGSLKDVQAKYIRAKVTLDPKIAQFVNDNPNLSYEEIISVISNQ